MPQGPGCQVDAGIITPACKLTIKAKKKFIQEVKDELLFGTAGIPAPLFPCGPDIPAHPFADLLDLENEKKFPEFHKNILGTYEKMACMLNLKSDFKILPICCPISLGFKLNVKLKLNFPNGFIQFMIPNLPKLAFKMKLKPPKLAAKFPSLPAVPPPLPKIQIPDIKLPHFKEFALFWEFALKIPSLLAELVLKVPKFALKLPNLPDLFAELCNMVFKAKIFGNIAPEFITEIVAIKVLTRKIVEMLFIAALGTTIGSSPMGVVGGVGRYLEYEPLDENVEEEELSVRDEIVKFANECVGLAWGAGTSKRNEYAQRLMPVEFQEKGSGAGSDPRARGKEWTLAFLKKASSCGLFARACLAAGGASYVYDHKVDTARQGAGDVSLYHDFFNDRYPDGQAISGIISAAKAKQAIISKTKKDLPPLKKGDVIIVTSKAKKNMEHALVLVADYEQGSLSMTTVEGGQGDKGNPGNSTAIKRKEYVKGQKVDANSEFSSMYVEYGTNEVIIGGRHILYLIDGEKLCTDERGSSMTKSNGSIDPTLAKDGPGDGFQEFNPPPTPPKK